MGIERMVGPDRQPFLLPEVRIYTITHMARAQLDLGGGG